MDWDWGENGGGPEFQIGVRACSVMFLCVRPNMQVNICWVSLPSFNKKILFHSRAAGEIVFVLFPLVRGVYLRLHLRLVSGTAGTAGVRWVLVPLLLFADARIHFSRCRALGVCSALLFSPCMLPADCIASCSILSLAVIREELRGTEMAGVLGFPPFPLWRMKEFGCDGEEGSRTFGIALSSRLFPSLPSKKFFGASRDMLFYSPTTYPSGPCFCCVAVPPVRSEAALRPLYRPPPQPHRKPVMEEGEETTRKRIHAADGVGICSALPSS